MNTPKSKKTKLVPTVFLSYASTDRANADRLRELLARRLSSRVFTVDNLSPSKNWENQLRDELTRATAFVVLLSPDSVRSHWVLRELGAAWGLKKPILPVVTSPDVLGQLPISIGGPVLQLKDLDDRSATEPMLQRLAEVLAAH